MRSSAIWEADAEAFHDHRGYVEPTEEDWAMFCEGAAAQGTSLWQVAWSGAEVVGQVRTYTDPGDIEPVRRAPGVDGEHLDTSRVEDEGRGVGADLRQPPAVG